MKSVARHPAPGRIALAALLVLAAAVGCAPFPEERESEVIAAPRIDIPDERAERSGGLFDERRGMRLFEDRSARRTGDIITVIVDEQIAGDKAVSAQMNRQQGGEMAAAQFGGEPLEIGGRPLAFEHEGEANFDGGGNAEQSTNLTGTVTAVVVDTLPNGHLVIRGEKAVTVSQGQEYLRITGIVRSDDVGANNEVASSRVANLRVAYTGSETIGDAARPEWMTRFMMRQ